MESDGLNQPPSDVELDHSYLRNNASGVPDSNESPSNLGRTRNQKSTVYQKTGGNLHIVSDYSRPLPSKDDLVAIRKKNEIILAIVHKIVNKGNHSMPVAHPSGCSLKVEVVPSCKRSYRCLEEALVVDRSFASGETVCKYVNKFGAGSVRERECWPKDDMMLGQVVGVKIRGDMLVMPNKNQVVKDVPLDSSVEYVEMVNYNTAHNYIMYDQWIGDAKNSTNEVTLLFRDKFKVVVRESSSREDGVFLIRRDPTDSTKALVPGEIVSMTMSDALGKFAKWEAKPPHFLKRKFRRGKEETRTFVVVKNETIGLFVNWITSPSDPENAPCQTITRESLHKVVRIDLSAFLNVGTCDRVIMKTLDESRVISKKQYYKELADELSEKFQKIPLCTKMVNKMLLKWDHVEGKLKPHQPDNESEMDTELAGPQAQSSLTAEAMETGSQDVSDADEDVDMAEQSESDAEENDEEELPDGPKTRAGNSKLEGKRKGVCRKRASASRLRRKAPDASKSSARIAKKLLGEKYIGEVLRTYTYVDVLWMDGTVEKDVPSYQLLPNDPDLDQQDHQPSLLVTRKDSQGIKQDLEFGLILSTDVAERSCKVRWFTREAVDKPMQQHQDETISLFDIMIHPLYSRAYTGQFGVSFNRDSSELRLCAYQIIADLLNGKQLVRYMDGMTEELWPDEVTPINFAEDEDISEGSEFESGSGGDDWDEAIDAMTTEEAEEAMELESLDDISASVSPIDEVDVDPSQVPTMPETMTSVEYEAMLLDGLDHNLGLDDKETPLTIRVLTPRCESDSMKMTPYYISYHVMMQVIAATQWPLVTLRVQPGISCTEPTLESEFCRIIVARSCFSDDTSSTYCDRETVLWLEDALMQDKRDPDSELKCAGYFKRWLRFLVHFPMNHVIDRIVEAASADLDSCHEKIITLNRLKKYVDGTLPHASEKILTELRRWYAEEGLAMIYNNGSVKQQKGTFELLSNCPVSNVYASSPPAAADHQYFKAVSREHRMLADNMPMDIHVRAYADRMDVLSAIIIGPVGTPFEAVPFFFNIRLPSTYPQKSPEVHFLAFSQEQLNPNLYQTGKVCTSLLGTWAGEGIETWDPKKSNLLQVILSIQGLILVPEPYFNEAGYESRKGLPEMVMHSQRYNETAAINALEYLWRIGFHPPTHWDQFIHQHVLAIWPGLQSQLEQWIACASTPDYPVVNSIGFRMALRKAIDRMQSLYEKVSPKISLRCSQQPGTSTSPIADVTEEDTCTHKVAAVSPKKPVKTLDTEFKLPMVTTAIAAAGRIPFANCLAEYINSDVFEFVGEPAPSSDLLTFFLIGSVDGR